MHHMPQSTGRRALDPPTPFGSQPQGARTMSPTRASLFRLLSSRHGAWSAILGLTATLQVRLLTLVSTFIPWRSSRTCSAFCLWLCPR